MELTPFEELIVSDMVRWYTSDPKKARFIVEKYALVLREVDAQYDGARTQARLLWEKHHENVDPAAWLQHVKDTHEKYREPTPLSRIAKELGIELKGQKDDEMERQIIDEIQCLKIRLEVSEFEDGFDDPKEI